jgi:MFS family permease
LSCLFAPLVFLGNFRVAMLGMVLWGIGMGAQNPSCARQSLGMVPAARRGTAYGVFNSGYGLLWFAGSALMGVLYDVSLPALIAFSVLAQLLAVPVLFLVGRQRCPRGGRAGSLVRRHRWWVSLDEKTWGHAPVCADGHDHGSVWRRVDTGISRPSCQAKSIALAK